MFVDCLKDFPATLLLRPLNTETLATLVYGHARAGRLRGRLAGRPRDRAGRDRSRDPAHPQRRDETGEPVDPVRRSCSGPIASWTKGKPAGVTGPCNRQESGSLLGGLRLLLADSDTRSRLASWP